MNVAMVVFSYYPADPRVRREAEALQEAGHQVDVVCLCDSGETARETVGGVQLYRLPLQRVRSGKFEYIWRYCLFFGLTFATLGFLFARRRYSVVHVHNMPDFLVFAALVPRLFGAKIVLDLHDPMPEVFMAKYGMRRSHPAIRALRLIEKVSLRFSHVALTPNIAFRELFLSRGCPPGKLHIVMNAPQESIFQSNGLSSPPSRNGRSFVLMYHGTILQRHGLDIACEAISLLKDKIPGLLFLVYGTGDTFVETFLALVKNYGLQEIVFYQGFAPAHEIASAIAGIDLGVIPNRKNCFTDINLPTRIFEYLALGKPVVAPRTRGILDYFDDRSLFLFEPGNAKSLAETISTCYDDRQRRQPVLENAIGIYQKHRWALQKKHFQQLLRELSRE